MNTHTQCIQTVIVEQIKRPQNPVKTDKANITRYQKGRHDKDKKYAISCVNLIICVNFVKLKTVCKRYL